MKIESKEVRYESMVSEAIGLQFGFQLLVAVPAFAPLGVFVVRDCSISGFTKLNGNGTQLRFLQARAGTHTNPFVFEAVALHGSTLFFNPITLGLGLTMLAMSPMQDWPLGLLIGYTIAGGLGVVRVVLMWECTPYEHGM
jgi:hypothetical protein